MSMDKYDDRKWLFTSDPNDLRGNLAAKAFLGQDQAFAQMFIRAQNYDTKGNLRDNDVHPEFIQWIVDAALHAREIDPPMGFAITGEIAEKSAKTEVEKLRPSTSYVKTATNWWSGKDLNNQYKNNYIMVNSWNSAIRKLAEIEKGSSPTKEQDVRAVLGQLQIELSSEIRRNKAGSLGFARINSGAAQTVFQNVYARWNELTDETKTFYNTYVQLQKLGNGGWEPANESEYSSAVANPTNYRINLKKDHNIGKWKSDDINKTGYTIIANNLPKYEGFGQVHYYTNSGVTTLTSNDKDLFTFIFTVIYEGLTWEEFTANVKRNSGATKFNVQVDNLVRGRIFAISKAQAADLKPDREEQFAFLGMENKNVWTRDSAGEYVTVVDGKKVRMGAEDPETIAKMKAVHQCYGTNVNAKDDASCKKWIFECLLSQDPNSLESCLRRINTEEKDFFHVATKDIKNLHPALALKILQQFGFHKYQAYDNTAKSQIWKVENVSHWLKNYMEQKFSAQDLKDMLKAKDQNHLLAYLDLVSQFVNGNPAILNKNYAGSSDEAAGLFKRSAFADKLGINVRRDPNNRSAVAYDINRLRGYLSTSQVQTNPFFATVNGRTYSPFGYGLTPGMGLIAQTGGAGGDKCDHVLRKLNGNQITGAKMIGSFMDVVLAELARKGKTLDETDRVNLDKKVKSLVELEEEMLRTLCYIDDYSKMLDTLKDYKAETLDIAYVDKFVERLNAIINKKQSVESSFVDVFGKILDVLKDESKYVPLGK